MSKAKLLFQMKEKSYKEKKEFAYEWDTGATSVLDVLDRAKKFVSLRRIADNDTYRTLAQSDWSSGAIQKAGSKNKCVVWL